MCTTSPDYRLVRLDLIDCQDDDNDRLALDRDALHDLAQSIATVGLINPVTIREAGSRFQLVAGYRRLQAVKLLGHLHITAHVTRDPPPTAARTRLAENLVRTDLTHVEEARAVARIAQELGDSPQDIASRLHRSVDWVRHRIALANYPEDVLEALHLRRITLAVADEFALVADGPTRAYFLEQAIKNGCSQRQAQLWRTQAQLAAADPTAHAGEPQQPAVLGPPPIVLKNCFTCHEPYPITAMSYVCLCPKCAAAISAAASSRPSSNS